MIRVYIGISGSGKTTQCLKDMKSDHNAVRVNRDDLRYAIYGLTDETYNAYFAREDWYKCEQVITDIEERIIQRAISKGKNVYADNTHLKQKYIKKYYHYEVDVDLVWCDTDVDLAIHRDLNRGRTVGADVIKKQFNSYKQLKNNWEGYVAEEKTYILNDPTKTHCYVFDIDGTLAEKGERNPYDYHRVYEDTLRSSVYDAYLSHAFDGKEMIICSGRDSSCRKETEKWLKDNQIYYTFLYMREKGDNRADWKVKEEFWKQICEDHYIVAMYDDRNQVVDHARKLGFDVFQVAEGNF